MAFEIEDVFDLVDRLIVLDSDKVQIDPILKFDDEDNKPGCDNYDFVPFYESSAKKLLEEMKNSSDIDIFPTLSSAVEILLFFENISGTEVENVIYVNQLRNSLSDKLKSYKIPDEETLKGISTDWRSLKMNIEAFRFSEKQSLKLSEGLTLLDWKERREELGMEEAKESEAVYWDMRKRRSKKFTKEKQEKFAKEDDETKQRWEEFLEKVVEKISKVEEEKEEIKSGGSLAGLQESKGAKSRKVSSMIDQIDTTVSDSGAKKESLMDDINAKEGHIEERSTLDKDEASCKQNLEITEERRNVVTISELLKSIKKLQKMPDSSTKFENIAEAKDKNDITVVTDAMKEINLLDNEGVKLNNEQLAEIIAILQKQKEEMVENQKLKKSYSRSSQQQKHKRFPFMPVLPLSK